MWNQNASCGVCGGSISVKVQNSSSYSCSGHNICLINSKLVLIPPKEPCWCVYERLGDHQPSTDGHKDEWRELNTLDTLHTAPLLCLSVVRCQWQWEVSTAKASKAIWSRSEVIYGSRGGEDMSGLVQSYCPLRVFSFLNLFPSAASILYGLNGGGGNKTGAP